jgi:hypothetical protein
MLTRIFLIKQYLIKVSLLHLVHKNGFITVTFSRLSENTEIHYSMWAELGCL